jgi:hypothetical protein
MMEEEEEEEASPLRSPDQSQAATFDEVRMQRTGGASCHLCLSFGDVVVTVGVVSPKLD